MLLTELCKLLAAALRWLWFVFGFKPVPLLQSRRNASETAPAVQQQRQQQTKAVPESVNFHFLRQCNYACAFCFHTDHVVTGTHTTKLPLEDAKRGLSLLAEAGMRKVNFSGGEPFLAKAYLGSLVRHCKVDLRLESVSIVSNGSLITEDWLQQYGEHVDVLAVSCDSFDQDTSERIGRRAAARGSRAATPSQLDIVRRVSGWCKAHNIKFKINTVVNAHNKDEDMGALIREINPARWKVFQCLLIDGENTGPSALRNAADMTVTDAEFDAFVERHRAACPMLVDEPNSLMRNSYLILDERMRFLDNRNHQKRPTQSILDIGVAAALADSGWDRASYLDRGGRYSWSKAASPQGCGSTQSLVDIEDLVR